MQHFKRLFVCFKDKVWSVGMQQIVIWPNNEFIFVKKHKMYKWKFQSILPVVRKILVFSSYAVVFFTLSLSSPLLDGIFFNFKLVDCLKIRYPDS